MKRRLEMVHGVHNKFWQIEVVGSEHRLWWGRRGTSGQKKTKSFPSMKVARAEAEKLVQSKLHKGYHDVTPARPGDHCTACGDVMKDGKCQHPNCPSHSRYGPGHSSDQEPPKEDFASQFQKFAKGN